MKEIQNKQKTWLKIDLSKDFKNLHRKLKVWDFFQMLVIAKKKARTLGKKTAYMLDLWLKNLLFSLWILLFVQWRLRTVQNRTRMLHQQLQAGYISSFLASPYSKLSL